jgi:hypothetical protein
MSITDLQNLSPSEKDVLTACHHQQRDGAFWFPRVFREVVNMPPGSTDEEIQAALLRLIDCNYIEVGTWNGEVFVVETVTPEVLKDLRRNPGTDFHLRTREDVWAALSHEKS